MLNMIPQEYFHYPMYSERLESRVNLYEPIYPRPGAFEVSYKGKIIFSKLESGMWPNVAIVTMKCLRLVEAFEAGHDVDKYLADKTPYRPLLPLQ